MGVAVSHCKSDENTDAASEPSKQPEKGTQEPLENGDDSSDGPEDSSEDGGGEEEEEEKKPEITVKSSPYDPRFPTTNQARNCYTRYNEFHRCAGQKSEDDEECKFYQRAYRSICPGEWVEKWNEQRENGNWAGKF